MKRFLIPLLAILLGPLVFVPLAYAATHYVLTWLLGTDITTNTQWLPALTTASFTAGASVWLVIYSAHRTREQVDREMNRSKKVDAYNSFLKVLTSVMKMIKQTPQGPTKKTASDKTQHQMVQSLEELMMTVMIYGSPEVVNAFARWRESGTPTTGHASSGHSMLPTLDALLRAIRRDLGESNEGVAENRLMGLLVIGGKPELDRAIAASRRDGQEERSQAEVG